MLAVRTSSSGQQQKFQTENKINSREVKEVKKESKKEQVKQQHRKNSESKRLVFSILLFNDFKLELLVFNKSSVFV